MDAEVSRLETKGTRKEEELRKRLEVVEGFARGNEEVID